MKKTQYSVDSSATATEVNETRIQVPALLRFSSPFIPAGVGVYYAYGLGDIPATASGTNTELTYDTAKVNKGDAGLVESARGSLPLIPPMKAIVDFRYCLGLTNSDSSGTTKT